MPKKIDAPVRIPVPGDKRIEEFIGGASSGHTQLSVARMKAPAGWSEPAQTPEFEEITLVLDGVMKVTHFDGSEEQVIEVGAGQAIVTQPGERIRYETPHGAEYVAICLPAFSPDTVHRDDE